MLPSYRYVELRVKRVAEAVVLGAMTRETGESSPGVEYSLGEAKGVFWKHSKALVGRHNSII